MASVRATRVRRLRIRKAVGRATAAVVVLAAGSLYFALEKRVTLVVDGRPEAVTTFSGSVGQLLSDQGIDLVAVEAVRPAPGAPLVDGMTVVVDLIGQVGGGDGIRRPSRGNPFGDAGAWAVVGAEAPLAKLAALPAETLAGGLAEPSRVVWARVVVAGKERDVITDAGTVWELLSAMGIALDEHDRVRPPPGASLRAGMLVRYVDVDVRLRQVRAPIPFATVTLYSSKLAPGQVRVLQPGRPGLMLETVRVRRVDGRTVAREVLRREVIVPAVPERRLVGRRETTSHGTQVGEASWYYAPGTGFTAAHPWLPFGTVVRVTNLENGRSVTVVINDRGPFGGRIIDLSEEAFAAIAPLGQGVCRVRLSW